MSGNQTGNGRRTIALIGLRGSGKTTVGRMLADLVDGEWVDVDEVIQRESGLSISTIFETEGEAGFRRREREAIAQIASSPPAVVSVGGGAVLDVANAKVLKSMATVVWLTAPPSVLWKRISTDSHGLDSRPPLTDLDGLAEMEELERCRRLVYETMADFVIDTEGRSPSQVARAILAKLDEA